MRFPRFRPPLAGVVLALTAFAAPASAGPADGLRVIYALGAVADSIEATAPGAWLETPTDHATWPAARRLGKVRGTDLAVLTAPQMAASLRAEIRRTDAGGLVGVDEMAPGDWTEARAKTLSAALGLMGADANRVVMYVSPSLTGGLARADLRQPLEPRHAAVIGALRRVGAVFLLSYRGDRTPISAEEFARNATNWRQRFAPGDVTRLHFLLGPAVGATQSEIWTRARASEAGRAILANGPGLWGVINPAEGAAWAAEYRAFTGAPVAPPPGGDTPVIAGGGLTIVPGPGKAMTVALTRRGRAIVRMIKRGDRDGRVIAFLTGPAAPTRIAIPPDTRPGSYQMNVVAMGDGLRDEASQPVTVFPRQK